MRRLAAVLPTTCAALLLLSAPALAAPSHARSTAHTQHAKHAEHGKHAKHAKPKVHDVTLVGVISDTPTATIGTAPSDTATSTITITVKGGDRASHGTVVTVTLNNKTVVRRGEGAATAADLQLGDHVSVRARKAQDGSWLATRVNAEGKDNRD